MENMVGLFKKIYNRSVSTIRRSQLTETRKRENKKKKNIISYVLTVVGVLTPGNRFLVSKTGETKSPLSYPHMETKSYTWREAGVRSFSCE